MIRSRFSRMAVLAAVGTLLLLPGCREDEQDRPLYYAKGVYGGAPDEGLDDAAVDDLRQRAAGQQF